VPNTPATWINVSDGAQPGSSYSTDDGITFLSIDNNVQYTTARFYNEQVGWAGGFNIDSVQGGIYRWNKKEFPPTSINNLIKANSSLSHVFNVYPNPAKGSIYLAADHIIAKGIIVSIINLQGTTIANVTFKNVESSFHQVIDISKLSPGVYFLFFNAGAITDKQKIIVF
jgi:hypothetical protein